MSCRWDVGPSTAATLLCVTCLQPFHLMSINPMFNFPSDPGCQIQYDAILVSRAVTYLFLEISYFIHGHSGQGFVGFWNQVTMEKSELGLSEQVIFVKNKLLGKFSRSGCTGRKHLQSGVSWCPSP